ncbi:MAG TPA: 16S rRNA (cytosine(1402)-N(4))-methyltransferase RsmH [Bacteroidales bacterium]|nr:16S rRNA (cytosine(1402)-N(4))-methyltransferase RsmH [Bacteroidales bacterium]
MYHQPALLYQAIEGLSIKPGGIYVDLTYGGGGHSRLILSKVDKGTVIAFDQDKDALANKIDDERLILVHSNFRFLKNFLKFYKALPVDGILADLGISSYQIDDPERGFSFRFDAPLDLRMNQMGDLTAADIINNYSEENIRTILKEFGEVAETVWLAREICSTRLNSPIKTTGQLMEVVKKVAPRNREYKTGAKVFQALRIAVNDELGALADMLNQAVEVLKPGGRLVIISYHSLEDRLVKNLFKTGNIEGELIKDFYGNPDLTFKQINRKPITPSEEEISENNRVRSAKLRIGERL